MSGNSSTTTIKFLSILGGLYRYQDHHFYVAPYLKGILGFSFSSRPTLFVSLGTKIGYKRFYVDLYYQQQLIPDSVKGIKKEGLLLPMNGFLEIGQTFSSLSISSKTRLEKNTYLIPASLTSSLASLIQPTNSTRATENILMSLFNIEEMIELYLPLTDDGVIKVDFITGFQFNFIPKFNFST